ncbi:MAG: twin-arginine translocase subunit TatC [Caldiserica bacterium]|nr:twin-arginine translocase subunit TatC [Caldisericota bacterium]
MCPDKPKPLSEHLEELRWRIIKSGIVYIFCACIVWWQVDNIIGFLTAAYPSIGVSQLKLVFTGVTDAFSSKFFVCLIGGLVLAFPVILFQLVRFIAPGLLVKERKLLYSYLPLAIILFLTGSGFATWPLVPMARQFFIEFGQGMTPMITLSSFISFSLFLIFGMGLIFLLPIVVLAITSLGIVSPDWLVKARKVIWIAIFIAAAAIAPNDGLSMIIIAVPVLLLFEISLAVSKAKWRKKHHPVA